MVRALPRVSSSERSISGIISGGSAEGFFRVRSCNLWTFFRLFCQLFILAFLAESFFGASSQAGAALCQFVKLVDDFRNLRWCSTLHLFWKRC